MNEEVEKVARAMHGADGVRSAIAFDDEPEGNQWDYRSMAEAAIAALDKHRAEKVMEDLMLYGRTFSMNGVRIDPKGVLLAGPPDTAPKA